MQVQQHFHDPKRGSTGKTPRSTQRCGVVMICDQSGFQRKRFYGCTYACFDFSVYINNYYYTCVGLAQSQLVTFNNRISISIHRVHIFTAVHLHTATNGSPFERVLSSSIRRSADLWPCGSLSRVAIRNALYLRRSSLTGHPSRDQQRRTQLDRNVES